MRKSLFLGIIILCLLSTSAHARSRYDMNGTWQFRTDTRNIGVREKWESGQVSYPDRIQVPGCWQAQGFGPKNGVLRHDYNGVAWYRKTIDAPLEWRGKVIFLHVGGVIRKATVYVNGERIDEHDGFSTPFKMDVTDAIEPGKQNTIVFRVDNTAKGITSSPDTQTGEDAIGTFNYAGNWGGIYGNVSLEISDPLYIESVTAVPDLSANAARFKVTINHPRDVPRNPVRLEVSLQGAKVYFPITFTADEHAETEVVVHLPTRHLWTPEDPYLYSATLRLVAGPTERDRVEQRFGMREITSHGNVLLLNGKPIYLRGFGDDNIQVLTGTPSASKQFYVERLKREHAYGFNMVRFHSMVPVQEYFEAADEVGVLIMASLPVAYVQYFMPHEALLRNELRQTLLTYQNHPSFMSLAMGDELYPPYFKTPDSSSAFQSAITDFYHLGKSINPRILLLSNDGYVVRPTDMVSIGADSHPPLTDVPTIKHEFGDYSGSLPDISLIDKFTGVEEPIWLEEKKEWIDKNGLANLYPVYVHNSQLLLQSERKYKIEELRLSSAYVGYGYFLIEDFPGGTGEGDSWDEGWFDYFGHSKSVTPEEGREINSPVLLMIGRNIGQRTMWNGGRLSVDVLVSNYGDDPIQAGSLDWELSASNKVVSHGSLRNVTVGLGKIATIGSMELLAPAGDQAHELQLTVTLKSDGRQYTNRWDLWSYPKALLTQPRLPVISKVDSIELSRLYPFLETNLEENPQNALLITNVLNREARQFLDAGGRVWLMAGRSVFKHSPDATFFSTGGNELGTTLEKDRVLEGVPNVGFIDFQWYNLIQNGWTLSLDNWPKTLCPIAGGLRTTAPGFSTEKILSRFGYIVEAKSGKGKLLITTLNFDGTMDGSHPESIFLFDHLLRYVTGPQFMPPVEIGPTILDNLSAK